MKSTSKSTSGWAAVKASIMSAVKPALTSAAFLSVFIVSAGLTVGTARAQSAATASTPSAQGVSPPATQTAAQPTTPNTPQNPDKLEAAGAQALEDADTPRSGASTVRIVRLSQVKGAVQLDRRTDRGFETAFANLPIAQGQRLKTGEGVAEVEFEDNSSLRLTPNSLVEFPVLQRSPDGATVTTAKLLKGTMYVSITKPLSKTKVTNDFTVTMSNGKIELTPASHIRLDVDEAASKIDVFDGRALVTTASGSTTLSKKGDMTIEANSTAAPLVSSKVEEEPFDQWDKSAVDYHKVKVTAAYMGSGYQYGINDLNYYGSFASYGSCGTMWRPYFTNAAWDPFANGVWAWYPGAGYSWVSPYPWGWTPFHTGSWAFCGGGWGWQPGGRWIGLVNHPHYPNCPRPPHAPVTGGSTLVAVNRTPLAISKVTSPGTFVFQKNSAGLGVPRASLGNLNKISAGAERNGSVSRPVYEVSVPGHGPAGVNSANGMHTNGYATTSRSSGGITGSTGSRGYSGSSAGGSSGGGGSHGGSSGSSGGSSAAASSSGFSGGGVSSAAGAASVGASMAGGSGGGGGHH
jgi:hypothetical protein